MGILVAVLGLPHGALDPLIARRAGLWGTPAGFVGFNLLYIAVVIAVVGLWLLAPPLSLVVFLLVSAMHFGSDWNSHHAPWLRFLSGFGLLTLPALAHEADVSAAYTLLAGSGGGLVAQIQADLGLLAIAGMLAGAIVAARRRPHESVEIILAGALALLAPPLIFFTLYFCALHSFRHLKAGLRAERGGGRLAVAITAVYTAAPLLVVGYLLVTFTSAANLASDVLQVVFIGLAGLTVPHMMVVTFEKYRLARPVGPPKPGHAALSAAQRAPSP
nr:Brp/Blh family beta-carotene 15,15'-dioxygenase [Cryobacterium roopkundense]